VWPTAGATPGTYEVTVNARNQGSASPAEATQTVTFVITGTSPAVSGVTLTPSPASPQTAGATVTFTAAAAGGSGAYEYEFQGRIQGGVWGIAQAYGAPSSWVWPTAGATPGTYEVTVNARNQGSASPAEATQTVTFVLQ
jgi:subtilase family serine protease